MVLVMTRGAEEFTLLGLGQDHREALVGDQVGESIHLGGWIDMMEFERLRRSALDALATHFLDKLIPYFTVARSPVIGIRLFADVTPTAA